MSGWKLSCLPPSWLGAEGGVEMGLQETVLGDSPSSVSRRNPKKRRVTSRRAPHPHSLGAAIVPALPSAQSWLLQMAPGRRVWSGRP